MRRERLIWKKRIRVGSRGSALALAQTRKVIEELRRIGVDFCWEIVPIKTSGDRLLEDSPIPLQRGMFVKEVEEALLEERIDLAVHSLKDLPTDLPDGLALFAVLEREDPREAWLSRDGVGFRAIPERATVGTSSVRRKVQIEALRPDLRVVPLRGNVSTRIRRMEEGQVDALVVAAAGLKRLGEESRIVEYFPPEVIVPAAGQGALAIEGRIGDPLHEIISHLNHWETWYAVETEREFLRFYGGGCQVPVGALATVREGRVKLLGMIGAHHLVKKASQEGLLEQRIQVAQSLVEYLRGESRG
ncbi:MAG: hydroxymethylbilane synthase [Candidatus Caldatribacteriaceae bacterium]